MDSALIIEICKIAAPIAGPIGAVSWAILKYKQERLKEIRGRAIDMDRDWLHLREARQIIDREFPREPNAIGNHGVLGTKIIPADVIIERIKNPEVSSAIDSMLTHFETISLAVICGAADEDMVFELMNVSFLRYSMMFRDLVKHRQANEHQSYCIYMTHLSKKWETRMINYKSCFI